MSNCGERIPISRRGCRGRVLLLPAEQGASATAQLKATGAPGQRLSLNTGRYMYLPLGQRPAGTTLSPLIIITLVLRTRTAALVSLYSVITRFLVDLTPLDGSQPKCLNRHSHGGGGQWRGAVGASPALIRGGPVIFPSGHRPEARDPLR